MKSTVFVSFALVVTTHSAAAVAESHSGTVRGAKNRSLTNVEIESCPSSVAPRSNCCEAKGCCYFYNNTDSSGFLIDPRIAGCDLHIQRTCLSYESCCDASPLCG